MAGWASKAKASASRDASMFLLIPISPSAGSAADRPAARRHRNVGAALRQAANVVQRTRCHRCDVAVHGRVLFRADAAREPAATLRWRILRTSLGGLAAAL